MPDADQQLLSVSRVLTEQVVDYRPVALERDGTQVRTATGLILEVAGGSHASCIVRDDGEIAQRALARIGRHRFASSGRLYSNDAQVELADLVVGATSDRSARVFFTSGGTESFETAIRLAHHMQEVRGCPTRSLVVGRQFSYHGMSLLARATASHPVHSRLPPGLIATIPKLPEPRCDACPLNKERQSCGLACADVLDEVLDELGTDKVAAVVLEPVAGTTGGALPPPVGYLGRIEAICRKRGVLLILDETVTAFWRTGVAFFGETEVQADIVFGGKCLAAGFAPLGCVVVRGDLCDELMHAKRDLPLRLTFAGNAVACSFGLAAQEYIREKGLGARVLSNSTVLRGLLERACEVSRIGAAVTGIGHLWAINVSFPPPTAQKFSLHLRKAAARRGIEALIGQRPGSNATPVHMLVCPPFDANDEDLKLITTSAANLMALCMDDLGLSS